MIIPPILKIGYTFNINIGLSKRSNNFSLEYNLEKWKKSDGQCKYCKMKETETLIHRLLVCPHFIDDRIRFYNDIDKNCHPDMCAQILASSHQRKLHLLLGEDAYLIWGHAQGSKLDTTVKRFLINVYRIPTIVE